MPRVQEPAIPANSVVITDFGAKSGGQELCTQAIRDAIDAVSQKGGGRVVFPRGVWLTGPITLKSNIELYTESGALLGIQLQGLPEMNLENVQLENIRMEADYGLTCSDVSGVRRQESEVTGRLFFFKTNIKRHENSKNQIDS